MERERSGTLGWIGLGAAVVAWDVLAPETLSEAVDRGLERHKLLTLGAIAITAGHLANLLPQQIDPFHQLFIHARELRGGDR